MKTKLLAIISIFFIFLACENTTDPNPNSNPELASSYIDSAKIALENVLFQLINNDQIGPEDIDFYEPQRLFKLAYQNDPNNLDANFGLALTNFLIINQEEQANNLFNEWREFFEGGNQGFAKKSGSLKPQFPKSIKDFAIPNKELVRGVINLPKAVLIDPPKFSDVQEYVENTIIPLLDFAIAALDAVDDNSDFTFMVSPRMQGDENAEPVEIDLGEIYALQVILNVFNMYANLTVAYNVDFWRNDSLQAIEAFSKGGAFLKLRTDDTPMNNVKNSFFSALDKMVAGIQYIFNETDSQDNDVIRPDDITQEDLNEIILEVNNIKNAINSPQVYIDDWDNNPDTPVETLTIDYGEIFDNPITDLKSILPDYTITVSGQNILSPDYDRVFLPATFEWDAQTFNQWIFPNPSLNGFLPGMTDSEFKRIFGITEEDWNLE